MRFLRKVSAVPALSMALSGCASSQLGYDPFTRTRALPAHYGHADFRIDCSLGPASCLARAEAMCRGAYRVIGQPAASAPAEPGAYWRMTTRNADNSNLIYVACGA